MRWLLSAAASLLVTAVVVASGESRVSPDSATAPARLIDTGLYARGSVSEIASENRAFSPQYPLWTDGATKSRWVYLPPGSRIDASDFDRWVIPVGTKFWKEFSFAGRKVETRMIWRASATRWVFATYLWNEGETDAVLAPAEGVRNVADVATGKRHSIPAQTDCAACHGTARPGPLGFTALQLSPDRDPNAIHGESLKPGMITLATLLDERLIDGVSRNVLASPPRIATSNPRTRTVLGYLAANCGSCHNGRGEIAALGPILREADLLRDADGVAASLVNQPTKWQIQGKMEGSVLVDPVTPEQSALLARLRSRSPSSQMPPLGTVLRDDEAVQFVSDWISRDLALAARQSRR
jgi:mono/diheme cytochrome c family protein